jgi:hypothetical protein
LETSPSPVETVEIDRLFCSPTNPRLNDQAVPHVASSLRRFGWQQPIVAKRSGEVIATYTRCSWDVCGRGQNTGSGKAGPQGNPGFTVAWVRTFIGTTEYLVVSRDGVLMAILTKPSGLLNPNNAWLNSGGAGETGDW